MKIAMLAVLVMGSAAFALPLYTAPVILPFEAKLQDVSAGRIYTGLLADGVTPVTPGVTYSDPTNELEWIAPQDGVNGETNWGLFRITQIDEAIPVGNNNLNNKPGGIQFYNQGVDDYEIIGIFYGRVDLAVTFFDVTPLNPADPLTQFISSADDHYKLYCQKTDVPFETTGPAGRIGADGYAGLGPNGAGVQGIDWEEVIVGESVPGFFLDPATEIDLEFTPDGLGSGSGGGTAYIEITGGTWSDDYIIKDRFPFLFPPLAFVPNAEGLTADLRLQFNTQPVAQGQNTWLVTSEDPLTGWAVPEPLTMLAVGMAVAGLGGYIRKRR
jgi:hypothetical protein